MAKVVVRVDFVVDVPFTDGDQRGIAKALEIVEDQLFEAIEEGTVEVKLVSAEGVAD